MKNLSIILLGSVLLILLTSQVFAQKHNPNREIIRDRLFETINLSEIQEKQLEEIRISHKMKSIDLHSELQKNRIKIEQLFDEEIYDEDAILNLVEDNNSIHNELALMRVEMKIKFNNLLTEEQRKEIKSLPRRNLDFGPQMGKGFGPGKNSHPSCGVKGRFRF